ncbi:MAG TPA: biopolymer transporter ExbD [Bacteroidia bacterium]|jgi:biopolymer transport protein ExbD|nr:biopolymer transporter ExbD [Bacteroidia bacterium]MBP9181405.1 biopolymer transporter ExbD [Bacteroidia bacterium]MBP9725534.1 biopolymer transporter ExbD [Bacteroidia bacterium]HLP34089.1 biopolymer transporter ExbD [Bacteroidia bacterium]
MNFRRKKAAHAEVQAGALSDILFFLMLFFLIISTLATPSAIRLLLPRAQSVNSVPPKQPLHVYITQDLRYYLEKDEVSLANFERDLALKIRGKEQPSIVLHMDRTISVDEMMKVLDIVNKLKLPVVIAVDKSKE